MRVTVNSLLLILVLVGSGYSATGPQSEITTEDQNKSTCVSPTGKNLDKYPPGFCSFWNQFFQAVKGNNVVDISALTVFPFHYYTHGEMTELTGEEFLAGLKEMIREEARRVILQDHLPGKIDSQRYAIAFDNGMDGHSYRDGMWVFTIVDGKWQFTELWNT